MPKYEIGARGHDYGRGTPEVMFQRLKNDRWQCTQLAFKKMVEGVSDFRDVTPERVRAVKEAMASVPMAVAVLGVNVELGSADEKKRQEAVADFISQMPVCRQLESPCMGSETTPIERQPAGTTYEESQKQLMKSLEAILPEAERQGVIVALEPVWHHALNTVETIRYFLDTLRSPNLKLIFDPANLMTYEWKDRQDVLFGRAMESFGELVMAVHFKGVCFDEKGPGHGRRPCRLEESVVDYGAAFKAMEGLPQKVIPVLREEAVPAAAAEDQKIMRYYAEGGRAPWRKIE